MDKLRRSRKDSSYWRLSRPTCLPRHKTHCSAPSANYHSSDGDWSRCGHSDWGPTHHAQHISFLCCRYVPERALVSTVRLSVAIGRCAVDASTQQLWLQRGFTAAFLRTVRFVEDIKQGWRTCESREHCLKPTSDGCQWLPRSCARRRMVHRTR